MTYDTINDEESTPLKIQGGYSDDATGVAPSSTKKPTSSTIVRALMVGTAVGALLLMAGPSKMTTLNKSSNVDGMVIVSSLATRCTPATDTFSGLSCKNEDGYCAGPGGSFSLNATNAMSHFDTCYVSNNDPPNDRCWSHSHTVRNCDLWSEHCYLSADRCDPDGYFDGDDSYVFFGIWHVQTPLSDGSCGNPCREFIYDRK